jgi:transcriptional regulator with XRE-family HTH domain
MMTGANLTQSLGENIAHYRKEQQLTQEELATISGLYPRYLSDIETGRKVPQIPALARLAVGLGVSIGELLEHKKDTEN